MSEQLPPPDPRAFASSGKVASARLGGRKRVIYVGASLAAICAVTWIISPGSKPHEEEYHLPRAQAGPSMIPQKRHKWPPRTPFSRPS